MSKASLQKLMSILRETSPAVMHEDVSERAFTHAVNELKQRWYSAGFNDCFQDPSMQRYRNELNDGRKNKRA